MEQDPIYVSIAERDAELCRLIQLIPKDVYYHTATSEATFEEGEGSDRYYKHKKAPLAPDEKKRQRRQRRDAAYGLNKDGDGDLSEEEGAEMDSRENDSSAGWQRAVPEDVDYHLENIEGIETLRQKLHNKIEQLRSGRNQAQPQMERARVERPTRASELDVADDGSAANSDEDSGDMSIDYGDAADDSDADEGLTIDDVGDVDFSGIITSGKGPTSGGQLVNANKPGSKMKRLKGLVEESKKKRQRLDAMAAQGEVGKERAKQEAWKDVIREAAGEKVLSNTKRLQKAIKRREKKKVKSSLEWANRVEVLAESKAEKIQKREQNIKQRKFGVVTPAPLEMGDQAIASTKLTRKERAAVVAKREAAKANRNKNDSSRIKPRAESSSSEKNTGSSRSKGKDNKK